MAIVLGVIETESELREVIGSPTKLVTGKVADRLNDIFREYIVRSPFLCIATSSADGALDVSPRGDPAGFVRILDEHTLLIPDRPGNKIADTLTNVLATGRVALIFLVPGIGDSFRVNGSARITDDSDLLQGSTVEGKTPRLGLVITVEEVHAVLEGVGPLGSLEPQPARRSAGDADNRPDAESRQRSHLGRRRVRTCARRAVPET